MFMIIGLTGTKASGKSEVAEFLKQQDFIYFSLSDFVREEATKRGLDNYSIKDLQDIGNDLREKHGLGVLAERAIEKIKPNAEKNFIIDGIRNPGEIEVLRRLKNFYLISFDAPQEQRFKWLVSRDRKSDPKTWSEFLKMDARDQRYAVARRCPSGNSNLSLFVRTCSHCSACQKSGDLLYQQSTPHELSIV